MSSSPLAVIIPLGPGETDQAPLLKQLALFPSDWLIVLATCPASAELGQQLCDANPRLLRVESEQGRGIQMNTAVQVCASDWLWFLHVDSRINPQHLAAVAEVLNRPESKLYCFELSFVSDGPRCMALNTWGANLRTRALGIPFGDQGFLLQRGDFYHAGRYSESALWGEDHLLVWQLRCKDIPVQMLPEAILTSARRYRRRGWWALTLLYQYRWLSQAAPWFFRRLGQTLAKLILGKRSRLPNN